eukprot:TRINITY_DN63896_c0_g1_i1.p1 TRINITY_DN63896_c0_g1~~TRINITY_DN63896_c0_g1_i1.p1  ORF type:complete len:323 (-),score=49.31 TRINITY_DN63896_c0_g1_i1:24-992(-)
MKLAIAIVLATGAVKSLSDTVSVAGTGSRVKRRSLRTQIVATAGGTATPADIAACKAFTEQFLVVPQIKERAIEKAIDFCATSKRAGDENFVCVHFKEALVNAFSTESNGNTFSSLGFCQIIEPYMLGLRGATRLPNVISGPLLNARISPQCEATVTQAFAPLTSVKAEQVPDLWYSICMGQDCRHLLPSQTRPCWGQRPTHNIAVCEAARKFMTDAVVVLEEPDISATRACQLYKDFVEEMGVDVEAYEHVVHQDSAKLVRAPPDQARARGSSQLVNTAAGHFVRDNAGSPVARNGAGTASGSRKAFAAIVVAFSAWSSAA